MKKLSSKFNIVLFVFFLLLYIFLVGAIFYLSAENGSSSSASSGRVGESIANFLNIFGANIDSCDPTFKKLVRKLVGHFGLFLVTSLSSILMIASYKKDDKGKYLILLSSALIGIFIAFLSEYVQSFADNRGPSVNDAFIDMGGYFVPITFYLIIKFFVYFKDKKRGRVVEL